MSTAALVALATIVYAGFAVFTSRAGGKLDPKLGSAILNGVGAALPLAVWQVQRMSRGGLVQTRPEGLLFSVLAGVAVGVFSILLVTVFARGGELSFAIPTIYGGAIAITAVVGWLAFGEHFSWLRLAGVCGIVIGIGLLALPAR
ncbi:MAG: hypothetical protein U0V56_05500 [Actinomycetota bacterium]